MILEKNKRKSAEPILEELSVPPLKKKRTSIMLIVLPLKILGTFLLICVTTAAMFVCLFVLYVETSIQPNLGITFEDYALVETSHLYYDTADGGQEQWTNIMSEQQRTWLDYEEIPQYMIDAAVSIEDKRFFEHNGVDWYRTFGAFYTMFFGAGDDGFGASTITQQLIKNLTDYDDVTVKRKIVEIFRALEAEQCYSKEEIITWYLNVIYLGENVYGVQAAANAYFGKNTWDLSLAECACIIGITNRPTFYNPYHSNYDNKVRQELILRAMYDQGYISHSEYSAAIEEELQFVRNEGEPTSDYIYSYYEETVINQAIKFLMAEKDLSQDAAKTLVYNGGLDIYTCIDMDIQNKLDSIYTNIEEIPLTSGSNQQLQSAMTIQEPSTGYVVAIAGGVGAKKISFGFNRATSATRPPGSSIKPLSVYGPALDTGLITAGSTYQDSPIALNGKLWPKNDSGKWSYDSYSVTTALQKSINTIAVRILQNLGIETAEYYLRQRLGITTLVPDSDSYLAPLALGQLTNGITVEEMTSAYCSIANGGSLIKSKYFYKICNSHGEIILDNSEPDSIAAFSAATTDTLTSLMYNAVNSGTGTAARLSSGMAVAGKTGTTGDNYDRWFCGFTPYYAAACWTGYDTPESIKVTAGGNPAAQLWSKTMTLVHEGLEVLSQFESKSTGDVLEIPSSSDNNSSDKDNKSTQLPSPDIDPEPEDEIVPSSPTTETEEHEQPSSDKQQPEAPPPDQSSPLPQETPSQPAPEVQPPDPPEDPEQSPDMPSPSTKPPPLINPIDTS